ncbi:hypothetical protein [Oceanobacillus locisalsi]|uniref:DUF2515 domain-containing protein n=1 Tax=Oceanobacillus locisalsi TaxID=546107 RepID=A0ABW3NIE0_9BACI
MEQDQLTLDMFLNMESENQKSVKNTFIDQPSRRKTFPSKIIHDFNQFMDHISKNTILLTPKDTSIPSKSLAELNKIMSFQKQYTSRNTQKAHYPYIHFLYLLALKSHLIEKKSLNTKENYLYVTERWSTYTQFTRAEQYFLLLETFWVDLDWEELIPDNELHVHLMLPDIFQKLLHNDTHTLQFDEQQLMTNLISHWNEFPLFLDWLGIWSCSYHNQGITLNTFPQSITLTGFGVKMLPIFIQSRPLEKWNLPLRRSYREHNPRPGTKITDSWTGEGSKEQLKNQRFEPFYKAFTALFYSKDLNQTLPRKDF